MFRRLVSFLAPTVMTVEKWAVKNASIATPDQLIAGAVLESIAKHFEDWELHSETLSYRQYVHHSREEWERRRKEWYAKWSELGGQVNYYMVNRVLENKKTGVRVSYRKTGENTRDMFYVNGVSICNEEGEKIALGHLKLQDAYERAQAAAAEAKWQMEENEKKWNLAESLLGKKRDEFGTLVPIKTVEGE